MRYLSIVLATAAAVTAQSPLTTTFASNNGQSGNMFDIGATNAAGVTVRYFDVNLDPGSWDLEVYVATSGGTHIGIEQTAASWTLVGSAAGVVSAGANVPTTLPICVEEFIATGTTQGFYVTCTNGTGINYTTGTGFTQGTLYAQNADIDFFAGTGNVYPFGAVFGPPTASRIWNGNIYYDIGNTVGVGCGFPDIQSFGVGCGDETFASFYEQMAPAVMDLSGLVITGINTGSGYLVQTATGAGGIAPGVGATALTLGDDVQVDTATVGGTLGLSVGSNCWIALGTGNSNGFVPSVPTMLGNPSEGLYAWTDLQPNAAGSGQVYYEEVGTMAIVTYDGVYGWGTTDPNTVQFMWDTATGDFSIEFGALGAGNPEDWLVGYSTAGASNDPGPTDLSGLQGGNILLTAGADSSALALSANAPRTGQNWDLTTDFVDPISPIAITFFGDRSPIAVPFTAIGINSPGCDINLATAITSLTGLAAGGSATVTVPVPANPALVGAMLSAQSICLTLQNAGNLLSSNGVEGTIGN
ncbi:MAG: hypothetical protein KAI24_02440 [Planctomycetes bacterium]|nr:hypothetical protein [Planctomycetota bacterium]